MEIKISVYKKINEDTSDKRSPRSRKKAFLFAFLTPVGVHNYYLGHHMRGLAQTMTIITTAFVVPFFVSVFVLPFYFAWVTAEGLMILLWWDISDGDGFFMYDPNTPQKPSLDKAIKLAFFLPFGFHNIYLGNLKRGIIQWGFIMVFISSYLLYLVFPFLIIPLYSVFIVVVTILIISWLEGLYLLNKKRH